MNIGKKGIFVERNIDQVNDDIEKLIWNRGSEEPIDELKVFCGEMNNGYFKLSPYKLFPQRRFPYGLPLPELHGGLIEKNNGAQVIFDIVAPFRYIVFNIIFIIFNIYIIITRIIPNWLDIDLHWNILSVVMIFFIPVLHCTYYLFNLKELVEDIQLCVEGYYNKYSKNAGETTAHNKR